MWQLDVMLAVDGSDHALAAVQLVRDLPLSPESSIAVLAVLIPREAGAKYQAMKKVLDRTKHLLRGKQVKMTTHLLTGSPAEQLHLFADRHHPDVIVMGAIGLRATLGIMLGGVAQHVVEYAGCPVLVVRAPYQGIRRVLLLTDGSDCSQRAATYFAEFPWPAKVEVHIVHVLPPVPSAEIIALSWPEDQMIIPTPLLPEDQEAIQQQIKEEQQRGKKILEQTAGILKTSGIELEKELLQGDAATEIIEFVKEREINLLVCGARGQNKREDWMLGSVTRKLVHYAGCSVLVVK
jgi:nucleotide-binding universal stress UspA family protein